MALSAAELNEIETILAAPGAVTGLRQRFAHLSVTRCDPSDVDTEEPFRAWPHVALYLVDGTSHCWQLTHDPARATGLVVVPLP